MIFLLVALIIHISIADNNYRSMSLSPAKSIYFQQEDIEILLCAFENRSLSVCKIVVLDWDSDTDSIFESVESELLKRHHESNIAPGSYIMTISQNDTEPPLPVVQDSHRLLKTKACSVGVIYKTVFQLEKEFSYFNVLGPSLNPLLRTDKDYFVFFTNQTNELSFISTKLESSFKYKIVVLIQPNKFEIFGEGLMFPHSIYDFHGKSLKVSVPNYRSAMEMKLDQSNHLQATHGLYTLWMKEVERKFNFSCEYFISSNGTSGTLHDDGKWSGGVGDVLNGLAYMSLDISHIYSREGLVEWASPFHYRALVFVIHKARYHFPKGILLHSFTPAMWSMFFAGVVLFALSLKIVSEAGFRIRDEGDPSINSWRNGSIAGFVTATFLGQPWKLPKRIVKKSPIRILFAVWLFFVWVTATAYQAKLTSLMGFPQASFVPACFEQLYSSDFEVGINALGRGESAYQAFLDGGIDVYKGLFAKSDVYSNATECVLKAFAENFACISGEGVAEYAIASSVSLKNGKSHLKFSDSKANFVEGGVIYQKRWIYRHQFDQTIRNAMNMGLITKWWEWHLNVVRADKRKLDKASGKGIIESFHENDDDVDGNSLKVDKLVSCLFYCCILLLAGLFIFCIELGTACVPFSNN